MSGADEISNVSDDCQSSNLTNPDAIRFARDYDREPLIVKDYALHAAFILSSIMLVFAFSVIFNRFWRNYARFRHCQLLVFLLVTMNLLPNASLDKISFEVRDELLNKDRL